MNGLCNSFAIKNTQTITFILSIVCNIHLHLILLVIPQGTVDNNLRPDYLAGPKALDPTYSRQPTLRLHDLCLEVLTVHGIELHLLVAKAFPYS